MKVLRFIIPFALSSLLIAPALALTKSVIPTPMTLVANLPADAQTEGMLVRGKVIYVYGGVSGTNNSDGLLRAMDGSGTALWSLPLDTGGDEIATAGAWDTKGNIWLVGTASPNASEPPTPSAPSSQSTSSALNPDAVVVDPLSPLRKDLTALVLWKVDAAGTLMATYKVDLARSIIARGLLVTETGIAIVGLVATTSGTAGFFIQSDLSGILGNLQVIGKHDTEVNSIAKIATGFLLTGSSAEKISGKPLQGLRDGIALSISTTGAISSVLRSADPKSARSWRSSTSSLLLAGDVVLNGKTSAVVTKFSLKSSSQLAPTWTSRFPSTGPALVIDGAISRFAVFASNSQLAGLKSWKPTKGSLIALAFDAKGLLQGAFSIKSLSRPISLGYSSALGLVVLGQTGDTTKGVGVSVFHAVTR
jgi:hypothetical protein